MERSNYFTTIKVYATTLYFLVCQKKKKPVDFDDEFKVVGARYNNMTKITIKVQLF